MSCSIDFYCRVFVRVYSSAKEVKKAASKVSMVYNCTGCHAYHLQPLGRVYEKGTSTKYLPNTGPVVGESCPECGGRFHVGGPLWSEPIHDQAFVDGLLQDIETDGQDKYGTFERMRGFVSVISEELKDVPLYYCIPAMSGVVHCVTPRILEVRSAFLHQGYRVSSSHANRDALKIDAPPSVVWDVMRSWCKRNPVKDPKDRSFAKAILATPPKVDANFVMHEHANPASRVCMTRVPLCEGLCVRCT